MANEVYANGREVSCKAGAGKSICSFPDVCFTPPENPATPPGVPIPYPNTGVDSDATSGSKTVQISGQEVMLKDSSYFAKSTGDEAGCAAKKGVMTSVNMGKVYFTSWSMDVKIEGENVVRHMDLTTHNHASQIGNTIPWLFVDNMDVSKVPQGCKGEAEEFNKHCGGDKIKTRKGKFSPGGTNTAMCADPKCKAARKCVLTPYNMGCCDGQTAHHLVPSADFIPHKNRKKKKRKGQYNDKTAPCICVEGDDHDERTDSGLLKQHGRTGRRFAILRDDFITANGRDKYTLSAACTLGAQAGAAEKKGCKAKCLEDQLVKGHAKMEMKSPKPNDEMPRLSSEEEKDTVLRKSK